MTSTGSAFGRLASSSVCSKTDVGMVRSANEDSYLVVDPTDEEQQRLRGKLIVVADGMGGAVGGAMASRIVVETLRDVYYDDPSLDIPLALRRSIEAANAAVHDLAERNPQLHGMGSTCTALVLAGGCAYYGHVGDSRAYLVRGEDIVQLTPDDSRVARMVRDGLLTPEEAKNHPERNVITQSVGPKPTVEVHLIEEPLPFVDGDAFVLCSDGLTGHLDDREIKEIVSTEPAERAVGSLIELAKERGGTDNITVHVVRIGPGEPCLPTWPPPASGPPTLAREGGPARRSPLALLLAFAVGILVGGGLVALAVALGAADRLGLGTRAAPATIPPPPPLPAAASGAWTTAPRAPIAPLAADAPSNEAQPNPRCEADLLSKLQLEKARGQNDRFRKDCPALHEEAMGRVRQWATTNDYDCGEMDQEQYISWYQRASSLKPDGSLYRDRKTKSETLERLFGEEGIVEGRCR